MVTGTSMKIVAKNVLSRQRDSFQAGRQAAEEIRASLAQPPKLLLCYLTVNHDQQRFLAGLAEVLGSALPLIGCSGQGVMGRGAVHEDGYAASVMALGGDALEVAVTRVDEVQNDTHAKGRRLGSSLRSALSRPPQVTLLHYDPLSGVDLNPLLAGLNQELEGPILGGAAAHFFGAALTTTYQYFGQEVFSHGAVAVSLAGDFSTEMVWSTGCAPVGIDMEVTRTAGNMLLELNGRPALTVWQEATGAVGKADVQAVSSLAIGVPPQPGEQGHLIRAAFVFDPDAKGILLSAAVPTGTRVTLFHRTVEDVLEGAARMGRELSERLQGKQLCAVLGFECGGRTRPFLGVEATNQENIALQAAVGPDAEWGGVICWGELFPVGGRPAFHNYAFPLLALAQ